MDMYQCQTRFAKAYNAELKRQATQQRRPKARKKKRAS
jgi:hypothetical protein